MSERLLRVPAGATVSGTPGPRRLPDLPPWPLVVLFAGFGAWWALGLAAFAVALASVPMLALLLTRGNIRFPSGYLLWVLFVVWACAAIVELDGSLRLVGVVVRLASYVGAGIVFLYVYNASPLTLSDRTVLLTMVGFFATVVVGGWLGVLLPSGRLTTPTQLLLPGALSGNDYVRALVHPAFAEVQRPYGSPVTFTRPSAPFAYTNGWGCNVALLVPFVVATMSGSSRRIKFALTLLLVACAVPAFATLNRGMFLSLALASVYATIRYGLRGRLGPLVGVLLAGAVAVLAAVLSGVTTLLSTRLQYSGTNVGRLASYREAFTGTLASPLFGNGSPRPSTTLDISVGTQGQLWNVMYSYGFVALAAYLGWFVYVGWRSRTATTTARLWMHVVVLLAVVTTAFYGYDGPQLAVAMVAAALVLRAPARG